MRILVTGAFGFVGRNLSVYLAAHGHYLLALDIVRQELAAYSAFFSWNQLEQIDWESVDAVIHLAGKAHDTRNMSDQKSYFDVNVGLTRKVIEVLKVKAQKKDVTFIFFSSVKAVADRVDGVLTEEVAPDPRTPYGQSKLEAEREVLKLESSKARKSAKVEETANVAGQEQEVSFRTLALPAFRTYILRPCMIHGPGNKGNLNLLYRIVSSGLPWPLGAFENRRSFTSIGNLCAVVSGLLSGTVAPGVYQMADDETLSTNELIGLMSEAMGRRAKIWRIPVSLVTRIAKMGDVLRLPLTSERLKKLTESYIVSNDKIKSALKWKTMPIGARDGLRATLESFSKKST